MFQGDLSRQSGCSHFFALKWCGHKYTLVLEQKFQKTGDLMYPDLAPLQNVGYPGRRIMMKLPVKCKKCAPKTGLDLGLKGQCTSSFCSPR